MIIITPRMLDFPALRGRIDDRMRCSICHVPLSWDRLGYGACAGFFCESCFLRGLHLN